MNGEGHSGKLSQDGILGDSIPEVIERVREILPGYVVLFKQGFFWNMYGSDAEEWQHRTGTKLYSFCGGHALGIPSLRSWFDAGEGRFGFVLAKKVNAASDDKIGVYQALEVVSASTLLEEKSRSSLIERFKSKSKSKSSQRKLSRATLLSQEQLVDIKVLSQGVDRATGEVFEISTQVRDSLQAALEILSSHESAHADPAKIGRPVKFQPVRAAPRQGLPWSPEDDERLARLFAEGGTIVDLAKDFGRTRGAIESRLAKLDAR